jgi:hypothetical protein
MKVDLRGKEFLAWIAPFVDVLNGLLFAFKLRSYYSIMVRLLKDLLTK